MMDFSIILAVDNENGIWKCGDLAWSIPEDMKYFKDTTTNTQDINKQNAVIMGRKTWESIPEKYRPFKNRKNFILSRSYENGIINNVWGYEFSDFDACLTAVSQMQNIEEVFIIWGSELYNASIKHPNFKKAYITRIYNKYHCDVFFHGLPLDFKLSFRSEMKQHNWVEFEYSIYEKKVSFLKQIQNIFKSKSSLSVHGK